MKDIYVLFGGYTAERQVSVMTGTNVWLKLRNSKHFKPHPFLLAPDKTVWPTPYTLALSHTVEEIWHNCQNAQNMYRKIKPFAEEIQEKLGFKTTKCLSESYKTEPLSLEQFIALAKHNNAFVFIGLHGGMGENGKLQKMLEDANIPHNGSKASASEICMDKFKTAHVLSENSSSIQGLPKITLDLEQGLSETENIWLNAIKQFENISSTIIIKPRYDGCSAGIVRLYNSNDLSTYLDLIKQKVPFIPENTITNQVSIVEISPETGTEFLLEPFIETDQISIDNTQLKHQITTGWIELTVGVLEHNGIYHSLNPSITVTTSHVLTVEEKFQGGTGVNLTPPPESIISKTQTQKICLEIEKASRLLGIKNYARLDIFFNHKTDQLVLIEANSLPALTPSTVIYHQALAENPPLTPRMFLEKLIQQAS